MEYIEFLFTLSILDLVGDSDVSCTKRVAVTGKWFWVADRKWPLEWIASVGWNRKKKYLNKKYCSSTNILYTQIPKSSAMKV